MYVHVCTSYGCLILMPLANVCSYEVNLAATDSPLTIIRHYQPTPKALNGSDYQSLRVYIVAASKTHGHNYSRQNMFVHHDQLQIKTTRKQFKASACFS